MSDWFFLKLLSSDNCKNETLRSLQYNYNLPELLKLQEYVEVMDAYETAMNKDHEVNMKNQSKQKG